METLREAVMQRLTAAAEEILGLFEKTMVEFEAEMIRQLKPDISARSPALGLLPPRISGVSSAAPQQQEWCPSIKEEEEEMWSNQEEDVTAVTVKNEEDEERPESSQRHHQSRADDFVRASSSNSALVLQHHDGSPTGTESGARTPAGAKVFTCEICGKAFTQKLHLMQHMSCHAGDTLFCCGVCHKRFTLLYQLRKHERVCRSGDPVQLHIQELSEGRAKKKQVPCPVCGEVFGSNDSLRRHFRCHTGEKPFGCPICGRHFRDRGNMGKHMVLHTGEKRFGCDTCGQRFTWKVQLKKHKCDGQAATAATATEPEPE
ncbi:zinc finger protein 471-like [Cynoglossus semilaevis]|uniref:zinc finger protein 471-like n=1 Tax=Cynoglossus semilaevis TaxID=244447 RepID=UPI000496F864|nr:zinc finger protein 471-like [Cynoglossus semilaevis]XP_024920735.1 zinc finger protein 471-like [Cynoglossus semilaevis]